jgi:predicted  nucleic acid-binding Zn-ribbon protein
VLKDDLIVKLDQFSNEMLILREEIRSLQTVKAALQQRITELEDESRKTKEELASKTKKIEEEDVTISYSFFKPQLSAFYCFVRFCWQT